MCKAQGAEGQGAKHLEKARQFLEHRLHAAVIKLEEEQHKQAIAHDDEQAKGALVDKEGPDDSRQRPIKKEEKDSFVLRL